jgi:hypothetical protein
VALNQAALLLLASIKKVAEVLSQRHGLIKYGERD